MSESLPVEFTDDAFEQTLEAGQWGFKNRPDEPDKFHDKVQRTLADIAAHPGIGRVARNVRLAGVQRIRVEGIPYQVYYRVKEKPSRHIEVVAFWYIHRGTPPPL